VKEFWKSVSILRSYGQKYSISLFDWQCNCNTATVTLIFLVTSYWLCSLPAISCHWQVGVPDGGVQAALSRTCYNSWTRGRSSDAAVSRPDSCSFPWNSPWRLDRGHGHTHLLRHRLGLGTTGQRRASTPWCRAVPCAFLSSHFNSTFHVNLGCHSKFLVWFYRCTFSGREPLWISDNGR